MGFQLCLMSKRESDCHSTSHVFYCKFNAGFTLFPMPQMHISLIISPISSTQGTPRIHVIYDSFLSAVLRGAPADPLGKGIRKDEWIVIAHFVRDRLDRQFSRGEQFGRLAHAQVGDLVHRAASKLPAAKPAQMFVAEARFASEAR